MLMTGVMTAALTTIEVMTAITLGSNDKKKNNKITAIMFDRDKDIGWGK